MNNSVLIVFASDDYIDTNFPDNKANNGLKIISRDSAKIAAFFVVTPTEIYTIKCDKCPDQWSLPNATTNSKQLINVLKQGGYTYNGCFCDDKTGSARVRKKL